MPAILNAHCLYRFMKCKKNKYLEGSVLKNKAMDFAKKEFKNN